MSVLSDADRKKLVKNPNVLKVSNRNVTYAPAFKVRAVGQLLAGEGYEKIFAEAGINLSLFESNYARKSLERWRSIFEKVGPEGFLTENRGRKATGRPKGIKFSSLAAEVAYLRAENNFLKKLNALEAAFLKKKNSR